MKTPKYQVYNETDGILADPRKMTMEQAQKFVNEFQNRFQSQGYYQTVHGTRVDPKDVKITIIKS